MEPGHILTGIGIILGATGSYVASIKSIAGAVKRNEEAIHNLWKCCERFEKRLEAHEAMVSQVAVLANDISWFRNNLEDFKDRLRRYGINGNSKKTED